MPVAEETIFLAKCTIIRHLLETYLVDSEIFPDYHSRKLPDHLTRSSNDLNSQFKAKKAKINLAMDRKPTKSQTPTHQLPKIQRFKYVKRLAKDYLEDPRLHYLVYCDIALALLELRKWAFKPFIGGVCHASLQKHINSRMDNKIFQLFLTADLKELGDRNKELFSIIKNKRFQEVTNNESKTANTRVRQFQSMVRNVKNRIINK